MFGNGVWLCGNLRQSHQLAILLSRQRPDHQRCRLADAGRIDDLPERIDPDAETETVGLQQALLRQAGERRILVHDGTVRRTGRDDHAIYGHMLRRIFWPSPGLQANIDFVVLAFDGT